MHGPRRAVMSHPFSNVSRHSSVFIPARVELESVQTTMFEAIIERSWAEIGREPQRQLLEPGDSAGASSREEAAACASLAFSPLSFPRN